MNRLLDRPGASPLGMGHTLAVPAVPESAWVEAVAGRAHAEVDARRRAVRALEAGVRRPLELRPISPRARGSGLRGGSTRS